MAAVPPVPPEGTLRALGVMPGRLLGTAMLAGATGFGLGSAVGLTMAPALAIAALTAAAVLATTAVVGAGLHRTVAVPVALCTRLLGELRQGGAIGRLPEAGAPLLLQLVRALNEVSQAIAQRDRSCQGALQSATATNTLEHRVLQQLPCAALLLDRNGGVVFANATARARLPLQDPPTGQPGRQQLGGAPGAAVRTAVAARPSGAPMAPIHGIAHGTAVLSLHLAQLPAAAGEPAGALVALFADTTPVHTAAAGEHELFAALSRQLREPLRNLCQSSAALVQMPTANEPQWREFAGSLRHEGERLRAVVDDLVRIEQLRSGELRVQLVRHDAANLTADALRLAETRFAAAGVRFELRVDGPTAIDCDGPRLVDALVRALGDACQRGQRGGVVMVLVQGHDERVEVSIADDQPGLRTRPQRAAPAAEGDRDGLDLAICRGLVATLGGSLHHEDSPFGGQQLRFVLPAATSVGA